MLDEKWSKRLKVGVFELRLGTLVLYWSCKILVRQLKKIDGSRIYVYISKTLAWLWITIKHQK